MLAGILERLESGDTLARIKQLLPGGVAAAIIDDNDFVRNAAKPQFEMQMFDRGRDASLLIARGNDDAQKPSGSAVGLGTLLRSALKADKRRQRRAAREQEDYHTSFRLFRACLCRALSYAR